MCFICECESRKRGGFLWVNGIDVFKWKMYVFFGNWRIYDE